MMRTFGIDIKHMVGETDKCNAKTYIVPKGKYSSPGAYQVESDASLAIYPLAVAAVTGMTCEVSNIGANSFQRDAGFAKQVLEPMGCKVKQTATSIIITGPPPGQLRALGTIRMELSTDALCLAACLGAIATLPPLPSSHKDPSQPDKSSQIFVDHSLKFYKFHTRMRAIKLQLKKFNVEMNELQDGIQIVGVPINTFPSHAPSIHCYDDYCIAMAFSVLACATGGPGALVMDKRCVDNAWPSWWDNLFNKVGTKGQGIQGQDVVPDLTRKLGVPFIRYKPDSTILITGMRGAGKSFIGRIAETSLGRVLIDMDVALSRKLGDLGEFVAKHGWSEFRVEELALLRDLLDSKPSGHVISLGGGIVEIPEARILLLQWMKEKGPVINVMRDVDEIINYLTNEQQRPSLGEPLGKIYGRRKPYYEQCSSYVIYTHIPGHSHNGSRNSALKINIPATDVSVIERRTGSQRESHRFFKFITGQAPLPNFNLLSDRTSVLVLDLPDVTPALYMVDQLTSGVDAIELRVDLLSQENTTVRRMGVPSQSYVALQITQLRQTTELPIIFTVRTLHQGGLFPADEEDAWFELLELGIRLGCEYVDVEVGRNVARTQALVANKGYTKLIGSWCDETGLIKWNSPDVVERYDLARAHGDIVRIALKASSLQENLAMAAFREKMPNDAPLITINMFVHSRERKHLSLMSHFQR